MKAAWRPMAKLHGSHGRCAVRRTAPTWDVSMLPSMTHSRPPTFGYYIFPSQWGQGYASEAATAATQHLIAQGVHRLVATVTVGNAASVRVLQKAGFAFNRLLPNNDELRGVSVDDEEYVKTA